MTPEDANAIMAAVIGRAAVTVPPSLLASSIMNEPHLREHATKREKQKHESTINRLKEYVAKVYKTRPRVFTRKKHFTPAESAMNTRDNRIDVAYGGSPAILAHELGHAANMRQDKQHALGRALTGLVNVAYSPAPELASSVGLGGFLMDNDAVGYGGVGAAGGLSLVQLLEEARATAKARKMLKDIYGDKIPYKLPLGAGFSTYVLGALGRVGAPLVANAVQEHGG